MAGFKSSFTIAGTWRSWRSCSQSRSLRCLAADPSAGYQSLTNSRRPWSEVATCVVLPASASSNATVPTKCGPAGFASVFMGTRLLTPNVRFSGRVLRCPGRRERTMKWRARGAHVLGYHGPLQPLVRRHRAGSSNRSAKPSRASPMKMRSSLSGTRTTSMLCCVASKVT